MKIDARTLVVVEIDLDEMRLIEFALLKTTTTGLSDEQRRADMIKTLSDVRLAIESIPSEDTNREQGSACLTSIAQDIHRRLDEDR